MRDIIRADSEWRLQGFVVKQLRKLRAKLNHAAIEDFKKIGLIAQRAPISYILAECDGTQYTLKAVSKGALGSIDSK